MNSCQISSATRAARHERAVLARQMGLMLGELLQQARRPFVRSDEFGAASQEVSQEANNIPTVTKVMNPNTVCHIDIGADPHLPQAWTVQDICRHS